MNGEVSAGRPRGVITAGEATSACELIHVSASTAYVIVDLPASVGLSARLSIAIDDTEVIEIDGEVREIGEPSAEQLRVVEVALSETSAKHAARLASEMRSLHARARAVTPLPTHRLLPSQINIAAVFHGRRLVGLHPLSQRTTTLGRSKDATIVLDDATVSRKHCRLERRDGRVWIIDEGAANPTLLNRAPVTEAALLRGDELIVGNFVVIFEPTEHQLGAARVRASSRTPTAEVNTLPIDGETVARARAASADERRAHLKRIDRAGREVADPIVLEARFVLGRGGDVDLALKTGEGRIELARVGADDGLYRVSALDCPNMLVNGKSVGGARLLDDEDVISVGEERFRYYRSIAQRDDSSR